MTADGKNILEDVGVVVFNVTLKDGYSAMFNGACRRHSSSGSSNREQSRNQNVLLELESIDALILSPSEFSRRALAARRRISNSIAGKSVIYGLEALVSLFEAALGGAGQEGGGFVAVCKVDDAVTIEKVKKFIDTNASVQTAKTTKLPKMEFASFA